MIGDQVCHEREGEERCGERGSGEAACPSSSSCEPFFSFAFFAFDPGYRAGYRDSLF